MAGVIPADDGDLVSLDLSVNPAAGKAERIVPDTPMTAGTGELARFQNDTHFAFKRAAIEQPTHDQPGCSS